MRRDEQKQQTEITTRKKTECLYGVKMEPNEQAIECNASTAHDAYENGTAHTYRFTAINLIKSREHSALAQTHDCVRALEIAGKACRRPNTDTRWIGEQM